jgi:molybdopterin converting factor subunit 1
MRVRVLLFAMLRERAGRDSLDLDLADGATAGDAIAAIAERAGLGDVLDRMPVGIALNREYVRGDAALADGDEVALIPPVSGGAGIHARVTDAPLELERLARAVRSPAAGAIVTFAGTTRDVSRLEYEAYAEMAEERMRLILSEALERHGLEAAAAEHRVGAVPLGEPSVIIAVSAAHRAEAFAGAREAIDRIKAEAPIWKREVTAADEGERTAWVEGAGPPAGAGTPDSPATSS